MCTVNYAKLAESFKAVATRRHFQGSKERTSAGNLPFRSRPLVRILSMRPSRARTRKTRYFVTTLTVGPRIFRDIRASSRDVALPDGLSVDERRAVAEELTEAIRSRETWRSMEAAA